jgi:hypothetical protein
MRELIADIEQTNPDLRLYSSPQVFRLGSLPVRAGSIGPANQRSRRKESH